MDADSVRTISKEVPKLSKKLDFFSLEVFSPTSHTLRRWLEPDSATAC